MRRNSLVTAIALAAFGILAGVSGAASLDDAVTSLKIHTTLLEKFGTDALGIKSEVSGGSVVLSGAVDKEATREGARGAALAVKGVTRVDNRITVGNGPATKTQEATRRAKRNWDNAVLEAKVKARLFEQVGENALKITVKAASGVVTLEGSASTPHIHATALETVKGTKGVSRVVDRLAAGEKTS